jgi:Cdc6-like AAA superfamily ATPase
MLRKPLFGDGDGADEGEFDADSAARQLYLERLQNAVAALRLCARALGENDANSLSNDRQQAEKRGRRNASQEVQSALPTAVSVVARADELQEVRSFVDAALDPGGGSGGFDGTDDDSPEEEKQSSEDSGDEAEDEERDDLANEWEMAERLGVRALRSAAADSTADSAMMDTADSSSSAQQQHKQRSEKPPRRRQRTSAPPSAEAGQGGGVMFVCGVPGSGKTLSVTKAVNAAVALRRGRNRANALLPPLPIFLNAMELSEPAMAYVFIWRALQSAHSHKKPPRVAAKRACELLGRYFSNNHSGIAAALGVRNVVPFSVLLVADEIDLLVNKNQTVLYNLFEWSTRRSARASRLSIIGISNTLDLPQMLQQRVASRMTKENVLFKPYEREQLIEILRARLDAAGEAAEEEREDGGFATAREVLVAPDAVELCAARVASYSFGDARKALMICRTAVSAALDDARALRRAIIAGTVGAPFDRTFSVTVDHIEEAFTQHFNDESIVGQLLRAAPALHRRVLLVMAEKVEREAVDTFTAHELWEELQYRARQHRGAGAAMFASSQTPVEVQTHINLSMLVDLLQEISNAGHVLIEQRGVHGVPLLHMQVRLILSPATVQYALKADHT